MKVLFITGEASGDLHAANLIKALKRIKPDLQFAGIGSDKMRDEDVEIIYPSEKINVLGFSEAVGKISNILEARRRIFRYIRNMSIDFAVVVDFPGFNIPISRYMNDKGIPVFYFITPQVWAWGGWRIRQLSKYFRHLFVILPFEEDFFKRKEIPATFLGHPLLDITFAKQELRKKDLPYGEPIIALLPGSRESEIKRLFLPMLGAAKLFKERYPDSVFVIALHDENFLPIINEIGKEELDDIPIYCKKTYDILNLSDLAIVTSGTATIESAMFNTPMVIIYKLSFLSWVLARLLVHIKYFGLINLIYSEEVVPELFQREVTPKRISNSMEDVYTRREEILNKFKELRKKLGKSGCYDRVADSLLSMV